MGKVSIGGPLFLGRLNENGVVPERKASYRHLLSLIVNDKNLVILS